MIDLQTIKTTFGLKGEISHADIAELISVAKSKSLTANQEIFSHGSYDTNIYFILKGLVRSFFVNEKGEEKTIGVASENQVVGNFDAIFRNRPSLYYYQTLEPTDFIYLDFHKVDAIISQNASLTQGKAHFYEFAIGEFADALHNFKVFNAEERYLEFIKKNPSLAQRVPNKYIANILGITPVQLSRIRKRLATKKSY